MPQDNYTEKRKYARLDIRSTVNFSIKETSSAESPGRVFRGVGKNIGAEGILFSCDTHLEEGTLLNMEIFLPQKTDPVYINGEVRWSKLSDTDKKSFDTGVKFLNIDKNHVQLLIKYVCGSLAV